MAWDGRAFAAKVREGAPPWALIGDLARHWLGGPISDPIVTSCRLPEAYLKWRSLISTCPGLAKGNDDHVVDLDEEDEGGFMAFLHENQGVWSLAIRAEDRRSPDPRVYCGRDAGGDDVAAWTELNPRFSQFALQWAVYSARFRGRHFANGYVGTSDVSRVLEEVSPLSFPTWEAMFRAELHFFAGEDLLVQLDRDKAGPWNWIWIEARTKYALGLAMDRLTCDWAGTS